MARRVQGIAYGQNPQGKSLIQALLTKKIPLRKGKNYEHIFPWRENKQVIESMTIETFSTGKRSTLRKKSGSDISIEEKTDAEELHNATTKLRPVIINMCISLLVMATFAVCFHI